MLENLNVLAAARGPKLERVFKMQSHQPNGQEDNHFPCTAGHIISDSDQSTFLLLDHLSTLLAYVQLAVNEHSQIFFCFTSCSV